jgi:hypothetical protein
VSTEPRPPYTPEQVRHFAAAWLFLCGRGYEGHHPALGEIVRIKDVARANRIASGDDAIPERIAARMGLVSESK